MEQYIDKVGSLEKDDLEDKSFGDVTDFIKNEVKSHQDIIAERTENNANATTKSRLKFAFYLTKETITGILLQFFDIGSDIASAVVHYKGGDYGWCALTLLFVGLPGLVCGLAITIKGLRKRVSAQRIVNYSILLVALPFLYPFIQIFVNAYFVYLMFRSRSHEVVKIMGHDVKQFKSLEGFLESGPQFVLQSYIILRGDKKGIEDFHSVDARRLAILCITIILSFVSLAKTGYNVNVPDPDEKRKSQQNPQNVKRFWSTSLPFHFICVLFRVSCLAYFFAALSTWTVLIIVLTMIINFLILHYDAKVIPTMTLVLGVVSVFLPNGYLLFNFAGTFLVDMTYEGSWKFLLFHMLAVTSGFLICVSVIWAGEVSEWNFVEENIPTNSVLSQDEVKYGLNLILFLLGGLSLVLCLVHWKRSIAPLYDSPVEEMAMEDKEGDEENENEDNAE